MVSIRTNDGSLSKQVELIVGLASTVVGLVGIFVTLLTFPDALRELSHVITGAGATGRATDFAGVITLFFVSLFIVVGLFFFLLGVTALLVIVCSRFGAAKPMTTAIAIACTLVFFSFGLTAAMSSVWLMSMFLLAAAGSVLTAITAAIEYENEEMKNTSGIVAGLSAGILVTLFLISLPFHFLGK